MGRTDGEGDVGVARRPVLERLSTGQRQLAASCHEHPSRSDARSWPPLSPGCPSCPPARAGTTNRARRESVDDPPSALACGGGGLFTVDIVSSSASGRAASVEPSDRARRTSTKPRSLATRTRRHRGRSPLSSWRKISPRLSISGGSCRRIIATVPKAAIPPTCPPGVAGVRRCRLRGPCQPPVVACSWISRASLPGHTAPPHSSRLAARNRSGERRAEDARLRPDRP